MVSLAIKGDFQCEGSVSLCGFRIACGVSGVTPTGSRVMFRSIEVTLIHSKHTLIAHAYTHPNFGTDGTPYTITSPASHKSLWAFSQARSRDQQGHRGQVVQGHRQQPLHPHHHLHHHHRHHRPRQVLQTLRLVQTLASGVGWVEHQAAYPIPPQAP